MLQAIISPPLIILGLILITAHYRLRISIDPVEYHLYIWLLGFKTSKPVKFNSIEKIYTNEVTEENTLTGRSGVSIDVRKHVLKAYAKLDNGEKLHLDTDRKKERLDKRLAEYREFLKPITQ